ncbi:MAG: NAD(P)/FAD-dependent oxidoreductase [Campylobacteraceae bacterium]|nr:NAD(P)/FAD-dependent oxidoreductase [Campylobacteraceae bacterium]MBS9778826.1 NAD(P)/FAD-dependent oxidoreductase [Campylobacteraceae bacterium]
MQKKIKNNIAIIGSGASGLVAGIIALKNNANVSIFEKNSKPARKILATGNGRCNVSNENVSISRYHGDDTRFIEQVLKEFSTKRCVDFFENLGVTLVKKQNGKYFPLASQASSISEALVYEFEKRGGKIFTEHFVEKIGYKNEKFILHVNSNTKHYDKILIASGSKAMSKLGSCSSGYEFAKYFGHPITPLIPSLVQVVCEENTNEASGVKFEAQINLHVENRFQKSVFGDVLMTKYGLSGSSILDISRDIGVALLEKKQVKVQIDCLHHLPKQKLQSLLQRYCKSTLEKPIVLLLGGLINKKLALFVLKRCKISPNKSSKEIGSKELNAMIYCLKNLEFNITDTKGFEFAEVVAGGVSTKQINAKTMESGLQKGLYFSGEVLDVDGDCGGFNLHWAWASGYVAGRGMSK